MQDLASLDCRCRLGAILSAVEHVAAGREDVYMFLAAYTVPEDGRVPIWHGGGRNHDLAITEFDVKLWNATVDHVTVNSDGSLVFTMRDGREIKARL